MGIGAWLVSLRVDPVQERGRLRLLFGDIHPRLGWCVLVPVILDGHRGSDASESLRVVAHREGPHNGVGSLLGPRKVFRLPTFVPATGLEEGGIELLVGEGEGDGGGVGR